MEQDKLYELKKFVSEFSGYSKDKLNGMTEIVNDLGIDGDDGIEFIDTFSEKFNVDFPNGFEYADFFDGEGLNLIKDLFFTIKSMIYNKKFRKHLIPIRLSDLEEAIIKGEWQYKNFENLPPDFE